MSFALHPDFKDVHSVGDLPHCRLLLMNNVNFPWLVLVPRQENLRELFDLSPINYHAVLDEVRTVAENFQTLTGADKMNIAALGNVTPQLHIHVIARFKNDAAWPAPVWNSDIAVKPYPQEDAAQLIHRIRQITNL